MEIKKNEKEIIIKINKEERMFSKLNMVKDVNAFLEYLFNLQEAVNGIDSGEMPCYDCIELYSKKIKDLDKEQIKEEKEECMKIIEACLDDILETVGNEFVTAFMTNDGYVSIDDSDNIHRIHLFFERLKYLTSIEKR